MVRRDCCGRDRHRRQGEGGPTPSRQEMFRGMGKGPRQLEKGFLYCRQDTEHQRMRNAIVDPTVNFICLSQADCSEGDAS